MDAIAEYGARSGEHRLTLDEIFREYQLDAGPDNENPAYGDTPYEAAILDQETAKSLENIWRPQLTEQKIALKEGDLFIMIDREHTGDVVIADKDTDGWWSFGVGKAPSSQR